MNIIDRKFLNVSTPSCHAGTIAFFRNKPVFAWFGGSQEGQPDVAVYLQCEDKVYSTGSKDPIPRWNPILFPYQDKLYLFVKMGRFCDCWSTLIYDISGIFEAGFEIDRCKFQILSAGLNGPVKTKPIVDSLGHIYCGSSVETILDWTSYIEEFSLDEGEFKFKARSMPLTVPKKLYRDVYMGTRRTMGIIQPSLWKAEDKLCAFFRSSHGLNKIYYSENPSNDTFTDNEWSEPVPTQLNNPNSGMDTVMFNDKLYLVYNPSETLRYPLIVSELNEKYDSNEELVVQELVNGATNSTELSYPYMIENEGKLHLVYTYGRSKIEYVVIGI